jgi:hypothetical protein
MSTIESGNDLKMLPKDVTRCPPASFTSDSSKTGQVLATSLQRCERELPAVPDNTASEMTCSQLQDSSPSRYASSSSTLTSAHPKSISILNLKNISLVKKRLAQMEIMVPERSRSSGLSSCSTAFTGGSAMTGRHPQRWSSIHSTKSGADSLVDFYSRTPSPVIRSSWTGFDSSAAPHRGSMSPTHVALPKTSQDKLLGVSATKVLPNIPPEDGRTLSMAQNDSVEDLRRVNCQLEESGNSFLQGHRKRRNYEEAQQDFSSRHNDVSRVLRAVEDIKSQLGVHIPDLVKRLGQLPVSCVCERAIASNASNQSQPTNSLSGLPTNAITTDDLCVVHDKLDDLLCLLSRKPEVEEASSKTHEVRLFFSVFFLLPGRSCAMQFAEIMTLLKSGQGQYATQTQQQADTVRYLNELNSASNICTFHSRPDFVPQWLEAFVDNGNSQVQDLTTGVRKLCQALGSTPSSEDFDRLLCDMRKLLLNTASQADSVYKLEAGLEGLADLIKLLGFDARSSGEPFVI